MKKRIVKILVVTSLVVCSYFLGYQSGGHGKIELNQCIPLEDVAGYFIDEYDYPCFELKDVGNQLDNLENESYADIMESLTDLSEDY